VRYSGAAAPALARDVLRTLEKHFSLIESELNFTPPESIGVILYTQTPSATSPRRRLGGSGERWAHPCAGAGLESVDAELSRVLKHELTHSFIAQKTRSACIGLKASCAIRAPTWIQEGLAQWMEGSAAEEMPRFLCKYTPRVMRCRLAALKARG